MSLILPFRQETTVTNGHIPSTTIQKEELDAERYSIDEAYQAARQLLIIMGVPIDNLTMDSALDRIEQFVEIGRRTGKTHQIATVNTDFLVKSAENPALRSLLQNAAMCTMDSMPLVWGSHLLGRPFHERVAGSDMVPALAKRAAEKGLSLYLMGAGPGVAAKAARKLQAQYPTLRIAGVAAPFWEPGQQMDEAVLADIRAAKPDVLLVAFGNPKQEWWIEEFREACGVPVQIGIGASLDFIAGTVKRAPVWMQNLCLEWVHRLGQEPGRLWKRYVSCLYNFGPIVARQWWVQRKASTHQAPLHLAFGIRTRAIDHTTVINLQGTFKEDHCEEVMQMGWNMLGIRPNLTINLADVTQIDGAAVGTLMELNKLTQDAGGTMRLVGIQPYLQRLLNMLEVSQYFQIDDTSLIYGAAQS